MGSPSPDDRLTLAGILLKATRSFAKMVTIVEILERASLKGPPIVHSHEEIPVILEQAEVSKVNAFGIHPSHC